MPEETLFPEHEQSAIVVPATGIRYLTNVISSWTTEEGEYAPNLKYKVYMPANDDIDRRPVVIIFPGGGTLNLDDLQTACERMVKLGYVTVAALYKDFIGDYKLPEQVKQGVMNTYNLIQNLRDNYVRFGIKKKKFFGIGTSAGGITWDCAAITANDTSNPYYEGIILPNLKQCLLAVASISGAANNPYIDLIQASTVQTNLFNGQLDPLIPYQQAQKTKDTEVAFGVPSQIHIYPEGDHTLGAYTDDIYNNPEYGIIPTFYNKLNQKPLKP